MKIAGIDPGTGRIGYALLECGRGAVRLMAAETIVIPDRGSPAGRLRTIEQALRERFERDQPDVAAVETVYFSKNAKTALAVAEARGVILLTAHRHVRSIGEYAPLEVKAAVTGYGRADKSQLRRTVQMIFPHVALPAGDDAVDAIAVALTAFYRRTR